MASPLEKALRHAEVLRAQLAEIERFIEMYRRLDAAAGDEAPGSLEEGLLTEGGGNNDVDKSSMDNPRRRRRGTTRPGEIVDMMERIIRENGHPMTRGEIVAALEVRDVEIPATDKARYVGTLAWRHKAKFKSIEGRGYWFHGEPVPPDLKSIFD